MEEILPWVIHKNDVILSILIGIEVNLHIIHKVK